MEKIIMEIVTSNIQTVASILPLNEENEKIVVAITRDLCNVDLKSHGIHITSIKLEPIY